MAATSVTGKGPGSADGKNKGSTHMTLGVDNLIGPRVMAAGTATLSGGSGTIVLPAFAGVTADYMVLCGDASGAAAATSATMAITSTATTLTLKGTGTNTVKWAVIKVGISGATSAVGND
jgi:hypothetical protein